MNIHIIKGSEERINNEYIVVFLQGLIFTICQTTKMIYLALSEKIKVEIIEMKHCIVTKTLTVCIAFII